MAGTRIGVYMKGDALERFQALTQHFNLSQGDLICAFSTCMSFDEVQAVLDRYEKVKELERAIKMTAKKEMVDMLRGKSPEQVASIIAEVRRKLDLTA